MSGGVVRIGGTVRRPATASSASVQAVLAHIRAAGLTCVPEPLGFDEDGRDVVGFLAGEVHVDPIPPLVWADATLLAAARMLRALHDATAGFAVPAGASWMLDLPGDLPVEVVCHNDFAPYNAVFNSARLVGVIDWETAAPGARVWDVAYSAYRFVPLSTEAPPALRGPLAQAPRLRAFCDAYGLAAVDRAVLIATAARRVDALQILTAERAAGSDVPADARMWGEHAALYAADSAYLRDAAGVLTQAL